MTSKNPLSHSSKFVYPKPKGFKIIGQLNITSLVKHIEELRIFIYEQPFDILCINETRLDNSISSTEVEISGYEIDEIEIETEEALQYIYGTTSHMLNEMISSLKMLRHCVLRLENQKPNQC